MSNDGDVPAALAESNRFPSGEELRMVRAIAFFALTEAARHGAFRATFHGFRVEASRDCSPRASDGTVEVSLCVRLGRRVVERRVVEARGEEGAEQST